MDVPPRHIHLFFCYAKDISTIATQHNITLTILTPHWKRCPYAGSLNLLPGLRDCHLL